MVSLITIKNKRKILHKFERERGRGYKGGGTKEGVQGREYREGCKGGGTREKLQREKEKEK